MSEFTAALERYAPRLAEAVYEVEDSGVETLLERAAAVDERPMMRPTARLEDGRRRWMGLRQWFLADGPGETKAAQLQGATRTAISGVIALLRQVTESRRGGVSRTTQLRHLSAWAAAAPDEQAADALVSAAFDCVRCGICRVLMTTMTRFRHERGGGMRPVWTSLSACSGMASGLRRAGRSQCGCLVARTPGCESSSWRIGPRTGRPPRISWTTVPTTGY